MAIKMEALYRGAKKADRIHPDAAEQILDLLTRRELAISTTLVERLEEQGWTFGNRQLAARRLAAIIRQAGLDGGFKGNELQYLDLAAFRVLARDGFSTDRGYDEINYKHPPEMQYSPSTLSKEYK